MRRLIVAALLIAGLAVPALAGGLGEMTEAERAAFQAEVRAYLLEHPEILNEMMSELEARKQAAADARVEDVLKAEAASIFEDPASYAGGNLEGDVTVVEFVDYRCGYCRKAHQELADLVKSDGNIRLILKEFPILGEQSLLSSRFAISVLQLYGPEAYRAAHDELLWLRADATPETLRTLAGKLGHDPDAIFARMDGADVMKIIVDNYALAKKLEINGTPSFVVGGAMVRGYLPLEEMRQVVADERG